MLLSNLSKVISVKKTYNFNNNKYYQIISGMKSFQINGI